MNEHAGLPQDARAAVGREVTTGLFYEILGTGDTFEHPLLFIHGGGSSGTTWRTTLDGRAGWADHLAARGCECWVTDWPGSGRSGYRDLLTLEYDDVVEGYRRLVRDVIRRPVIVVPHSMGGAVTWRLVEEIPDLIAGVVAIAAAYPANIQRRSSVISDDGDVVRLTFVDTGVPFLVDRRVPYTYDDAYLHRQSIGESTQFDPSWLPALKAGLGAMSPRMLLQRVGVLPGMPIIKRTESFRSKRVRLMAGGADPAHTRDIEQRTADLLSSWGADASVVWLPDLGIGGNGHHLPRERNYLEILGVVVDQLTYIADQQ